MADDFQTEVCGESWWINSSRSMFGSSLCSPAIDNIGGFGWPSDLLEARTRSSSDEPILFHKVQKPQQLDSVTGTALMEMMGISISSPATTDWKEASIGAESNYHHPMLQEDSNSRVLNYKQTGVDSSEIQKEWSPTNLPVGGQLGSPINAFKPMDEGLSLEEPCLGSVTGSGNCQGIPTSFSTSSASYSYSSTLMETLFNTNLQPQESPFEKPSANNSSPTTNSNHFSLPKLSQLCSLLKPSFPKQQPTSHLPFNNTSTAAIQASFFPSAISQFLVSTFEEKPNSPNLNSKCSSSVVKKNSSEPAFKRPRIETPSPLPTFKVRKEKLGDRITVLQQLVSPFGKTDTASVLQEAIEYIKFLHDQLGVLSSPYLKNEVPIPRQQTCEKLKDSKQDLRSRGLCLVPISSTYPVANETTADFWRQTFGKMSC